MTAVTSHERALIDTLTYISYAHNRTISPDISPERWAKIFPDAQRLEWRYETEVLFPPCEMEFEVSGYKCGKPSILGAIRMGDTSAEVHLCGECARMV
jgi:hypothetical protein